jgi:hypothetical protein
MKVLARWMQTCCLLMVIATACMVLEDITTASAIEDLDWVGSALQKIAMLCGIAFTWLIIKRALVKGLVKCAPHFEGVHKSIVAEFPFARWGAAIAYTSMHLFLISEIALSLAICWGCGGRSVVLDFGSSGLANLGESGFDLISLWANTGMFPLGLFSLLVISLNAFAEMWMLDRLAFKWKSIIANSGNNQIKLESLDKLITLELYRDKPELAEKYSLELLRLASLV